MRRIVIMDRTLQGAASGKDRALGFKERLEAARQLDRLGVDEIVCPGLTEERTDLLLARTLATTLKMSTLSIPVGKDPAAAFAAIAEAKHPRLLVELPVSAAQMEYVCHKKGPDLLELCRRSVAECRALCPQVTFVAEDATRAEPEFLHQVIAAAVEAGADRVILRDSAGTALPEELGRLVAELSASVPGLAGGNLGVACSDELHMATACGIAALAAGAGCLCLSVGGGDLGRLEETAQVLQVRGAELGLCSGLAMTEIRRGIRKLWFADPGLDRTEENGGARTEEERLLLSASTSRERVLDAVKKLGYELSDEDACKVYEDFCRVAEKRPVSAGELDAIVATSALSVPPTYKLVDYVTNSGNAITPTANVRLEREGETLQGLSSGDGPIDAAFLAIEHITGHHYELDDFQVQAVTEGREAMGSALVRLRSGGKLYSGKGLSTDIIGASIRAYLAALNKIVFENR